MFQSTRRSLMLLAGAWLLSTPGITLAGGPFYSHHHHGYVSTTTTSSSGLVVTPASTFMTTSLVPASTFVNVVPVSTLSVVPASSYVNLTPASSYVNLTPASSYVNLTPASSYVNVAPASSYMNVTPASSYVMVPASSLTNAASPLSALAASNTLAGFNSSTAMSASLSQAAMAQPMEAQAASSSFPYLAQSAQARGMDGGKYVVFLRNFARTVVASFGGQAAIKGNVKTLLTDLIGTHLGPLSGPVVAEVDKILDELFGTTTPTTTMNPTAAGGDGQCFTIRVCIEGNKVIGNVVNPAVTTPGGNVSPPINSGKVPSLAPIMSPPMGKSDDRVPPAPPAPAEAPVAVPRAENLDQQHQEVMAALNGINESLKKLSGPR